MIRAIAMAAYIFLKYQKESLSIEPADQNSTLSTFRRMVSMLIISLEDFEKAIEVVNVTVKHLRQSQKYIENGGKEIKFLHSRIYIHNRLEKCT